MPNDKRISYEETYIPKPEKVEPAAVGAGILAVVLIVVLCLQILGVL